MPHITTHVECPIHSSFRVAQVAALFDLPLAEKSRATFALELPAADELAPPTATNASQPWSVGAIVGPSGSGKTTLAKAAYGPAVYQPQPWPADRAVIDGFSDRPIREIVRVLTAVGLGSPPAWVRPYHVLSNGERFRCDLARALLGTGDRISDSATPPTLVFDEFTSVVDRTVAQVASAAVSQAIRSGRIRTRLVAVTCHADVVPWLEPDWVADLATGQLTWGRLRRPSIRLRVVRAPRAAWQLFARHHYLSGALNPAAQCWIALLQGELGARSWELGQATGADLRPQFPAPNPQPLPVAFCAIVPQMGQRGCKRIARVVTLPDYQGLGIGLRLVERVCQFESARGTRLSITASHPALIAACRRSPLWRCTQFKPLGHNPRRLNSRRVPTSHGRCVATFVWVCPSSVVSSH